MIRFKNPLEGEVIVDDLIHGRVSFQNAELDDLIIARSDGNPTYNFCVVVDDMDMGITHVIRGDDHLNNTPRQINMLHALGATAPVYAHVPMILGPDGAKLSKRHGAVSVLQYQRGGLPARCAAQLPGAARLVAWRSGGIQSRGDDRRLRHQGCQQGGLGVQSRQAAVAQPAAHDARAHHLARGGIARSTRAFGCARGGDQDELLEGVADAQRERARTLSEMAQNSLFFFRDFEAYDEKAAKKHLTPESVPLLQALSMALGDAAPWNATTVQAAISGVADRAGLGLGKVAQPLRVAVTGGAVSPPIDVTVALLGAQRAQARIARAERRALE